MNKITSFVIIFGILIVGGVGYLLVQDSDEPTTTSNASEMNSTVDPELSTDSNTSEESSKESENNADSKGVYADYSESTLASAEGEKVIFFHAPWCSQCRSIESGIKADGVPDGFTILKADYDSETKLKQKYGVTLQTTFVKLDKDNNLVKKFVAYDEPTFDAVKEDFLL